MFGNLGTSSAIFGWFSINLGRPSAIYSNGQKKKTLPDLIVYPLEMCWGSKCNLLLLKAFLDYVLGRGEGVSLSFDNI